MTTLINSLQPIGNSLKEHKSLYKVLTPSIKPPYKFLWAYGSSWHHMVSLGAKELSHEDDQVCAKYCRRQKWRPVLSKDKHLRACAVCCVRRQCNLKWSFPVTRRAYRCEQMSTTATLCNGSSIYNSNLICAVSWSVHFPLCSKHTLTTSFTAIIYLLWLATHSRQSSHPNHVTICTRLSIVIHVSSEHHKYWGTMIICMTFCYMGTSCAWANTHSRLMDVLAILQHPPIAIMLKKISSQTWKSLYFVWEWEVKLAKWRTKTSAFSEKARPCQRLHSPLLEVSGEWKYNVLACQCRALHTLTWTNANFLCLTLQPIAKSYFEAERLLAKVLCGGWKILPMAIACWQRALTLTRTLSRILCLTPSLDRVLLTTM